MADTPPDDTTPRPAATTPGTEAPPPRPAAEPAPILPDFKKKDLLDAVVARSGAKKRDAKPVVEAMLAVLGESVAQGRGLNLEPFGKLRIKRAEQKGTVRVTVCRLRQSGGAVENSDQQPLDNPVEERY